MDRDRLRGLLDAVSGGEITAETALREIAWLPVQALEASDGVFARIDHHRGLRQGQPEVVFGEGKTPEHVVSAARAIVDRGDGLLATRLAPRAAEALRDEFPDIEVGRHGRVALLGAPTAPEDGVGPVLVVSAGTADSPVVEEAVFTCRAFGTPVAELRDVGVAGLHRLVAERAAFEGASVVIVVAGMEGALPSVVGGLVSGPVIGVPTSVGYGSALGGFTPLFAMLTSCAAGITVTNIDNGFGAAAAASRIRRAIAARATARPAETAPGVDLAPTVDAVPTLEAGPADDVVPSGDAAPPLDAAPPTPASTERR